MISNKKHLVASILSVILAVSTFGLFIFLCWTAAAGEQGAIAFVFGAPVLVILIGTSFLLGLYAAKDPSIGKASKNISIIVSAFLIFFYISPTVGLHVWTNGIISLVSKSFKMVTGKTPMQWNDERYK